MKRKRTTPHEHSVQMAFDAFRICIGMKPKTFTGEEVIEWMCRMIGTEVWK